MGWYTCVRVQYWHRHPEPFIARPDGSQWDGAVTQSGPRAAGTKTNALDSNLGLFEPIMMIEPFMKLVAYLRSYLTL